MHRRREVVGERGAYGGEILADGPLRPHPVADAVGHPPMPSDDHAEFLVRRADRRARGRGSRRGERLERPRHVASRRVWRYAGDGQRADRGGVLVAQVRGREHLTEVAEHAREVRRIDVDPGTASLGRRARRARRQQREKHQLLEPRRAPPVVLEEQQRAREVAHRARAEQHECVRGALHRPAAAVVVRRVRDTQHLHGQRVVAQHDVREALGRVVVAADRGHEILHRLRKRGHVVGLQHAADDRVQARLGV